MSTRTAIAPAPRSWGRPAGGTETDQGGSVNHLPTQTCMLCGRVVTVTPDGRGFPPDIAKRKLKKLCATADCPSRPAYRAGIQIGGPITGQGRAAPVPHPAAADPSDGGL